MRNILLLVLVLTLASCAKEPDYKWLASETGVDVSALPPYSAYESGDEIVVYDSGASEGSRIAGITFSGSVTEFLTGQGTFVTNDTMTYPGAGIALSTGSAWGTSYSLTTLKNALDDETWTFDNTVTIGTLIVTSSADLPSSVSMPTAVKTTAAAYTIGTTSAAECFGGTVYVTSAAVVTACDAISSGMRFKVITIGAIAVSLDTQSDDLMVLDGTALDNGDKATNTSTTGDEIQCQYYSADGWYCTSDGWSDGGA